MPSIDTLSRYSKQITSEHVLLLFFLVLAIGAYWVARDFTFGGRVFPQLMAVIIVVGTLLVLFQERLPAAVQEFITGSVGFVDEDLEEQSAGIVGEIDRTLPRYQKPLGPVMFTVVMIFMYTAIGYLIGFLWVSPIFAAVYLYWFDKHWLYVIGIGILAFAIAYVFISVFGIRLHEGRLITIGEGLAPGVIHLGDTLVIEVSHQLEMLV